LVIFVIITIIIIIIIICEELIRLLSLHKLIANKLVAVVNMENNTNTVEQGSPNDYEHQSFQIIEAVLLHIIASRSP
jgi:hypothetical protein